WLCGRRRGGGDGRRAALDRAEAPQGRAAERPHGRCLHRTEGRDGRTSGSLVMGKRRAFWAALTLVIALSASCTAILGIDGKDWHLADAGKGGGGAIGSSASTGGAGGGCAAGETACSGKCVNTDTDPANCGGCGKACAMGQTCQVGSCAGDCGPTMACDDQNP